MNTVFTQHAVARMQARDVNDIDVSRLLEKVEHVSRDRETLTRSEDVVRLGKRHGEETFIVRAGDMRAVLALTQDRPEQMIVLGVFRADEAPSSIDRLQPGV